jgi:hypothetical protein
MVGMGTLLSLAGFMTSCKSPQGKQEKMLSQSNELLSNVESGLALPTDLECPSTLNVTKGKIGLKHIEGDLAPILFKAWQTGFAVQSNFARENAGHVAMAASMQLITTRVTEGVYSSIWQITAKGIRLLNELEWVDTIEEDNNNGC